MFNTVKKFIDAGQMKEYRVTGQDERSVNLGMNGTFTQFTYLYDNGTRSQWYRSVFNGVCDLQRNTNDLREIS